MNAKKFTRTLIMLAAIFLAASASVYALPKVDEVVSGDVTITNLLAGEVAELALIRDVSEDDYGQVVGVFALEIRYVRNVAR